MGDTFEAGIKINMQLKYVAIEVLFNLNKRANQSTFLTFTISVNIFV